MIIIVRVGLGLAYQGVSSTPSRQLHCNDPTSCVPSPGRRNNGQLSRLQAASPQEDDILQNLSLRGSSSRTKLDIGTGLDSRVAGNELYATDRNSGERNGEDKGETVSS